MPPSPPPPPLARLFYGCLALHNNSAVGLLLLLLLLYVRLGRFSRRRVRVGMPDRSVHLFSMISLLLWMKFVVEVGGWKATLFACLRSERRACHTIHRYGLIYYWRFVSRTHQPPLQRGEGHYCSNTWYLVHVTAETSICMSVMGPAHTPRGARRRRADIWCLQFSYWSALFMGCIT